MRSRLIVFLGQIVIASAFLYHQDAATREQQVTPIEPRILTAAAFAVSPTVRSIAIPSTRARPADGSQVPLREINEKEEEGDERSFEDDRFAHDADGAIAKFSSTSMPQPILSFDGISNFDNIDLYGGLFIPPDPIGDVGPNHYVQAVNAAIRIYDKTGNALTPPFKLSSLTSALGTPCSTRNDGDPTVVYDPLADRWLLSEFCTAFPPFRQMVAISRTGDPTGEYYIYEFVMPNVRLNDYAKLSAWPDAYYMSSDEFLGSDYVGSGAFAFERRKMLAGDPTAALIYFNLPKPPAERVGGLLPADLDGLTAPPDGAPNVFVGYSATEYGDPSDAIRLYDFHADFEVPQNSYFRERSESPIAVAAFDPTSPMGRNDIAQPPPGEALDSLSDRLMYRIAYRNLGDRESLVFDQTVRTTPVGGPYRAGVRVYELTQAGGAYSVAEQSTIGDTADSRWLGAAAQDHQGNIAVAYSLSSSIERPSIMYSGRLAGDAPGTLRPETKLVTGTGVQKAFGFRWGDYSSLTVDPVDDCTFWVTNEYFSQESQDFSDFTWLTRIGAFKFDECTPAPRASISGMVTNAQTGEAIAGAFISTRSYSRFSDVTGAYPSMVVPPGDFLITVTSHGYAEAFAAVTVSNGQALVRDFALEPIPSIEKSGLAITSESCGINNTLEPGETVTVELALKNTGRLNADDVTVSLDPSRGVTNPGAMQRYGTLIGGRDAVSRPFTFTVSPRTVCGGEIDLPFSITSAGKPIRTLHLQMRAGQAKYALSQNFNSSRARLPEGWTSSASGAGRVWFPSTRRSTSPLVSLFSPDPSQVGVNEIVSPPFRITSTFAELTFRNWYELETTFLRNRLFDGSVLEISFDNGEWQDIETAGGRFITGGYDGMIDACCQNPFAGRMGWSGRSGINRTAEFITSTVRLPASAAGREVRLRWRIGSDIGTFREGQYIDDVAVSDGFTCSCSFSPWQQRQGQ
jgi:hypothetical protein